MKKIGLVGVAVATMFNGEVVVCPVVGLETVSGKSFEPAGAEPALQERVVGSSAATM